MCYDSEVFPCSKCRRKYKKRRRHRECRCQKCVGVNFLPCGCRRNCSCRAEVVALPCGCRGRCVCGGPRVRPELAGAVALPAPGVPVIQPFPCGCVGRCRCGVGAFGALLPCGCRGRCVCNTARPGLVTTTQQVIGPALASPVWPGGYMYPGAYPRPPYGGCPGGGCY